MPNKEYEEAYIEIIKLASLDIITASDNGEIDDNTENYEWINP